MLAMSAVNFGSGTSRDSLRLLSYRKRRMTESPNREWTSRCVTGEKTLKETYLMANREEFATADLGIEICSPQSSPGMALLGATACDEREFATPDGQHVRVTVLSALPHRAAE